MQLAGKNIIVGVSGGIAAYKAAEVVSLLRKAGAEVRVAMTKSAPEFISALTFEALTQHPVYGGVFGDKRSYEMEHITWSKWADLLLVAPASADILARMAVGLADDPVAALYLSFSKPVFVAPAMNTQMLEHPATVHNLELLKLRGVAVIEPESGDLACGDVGSGRLASPLNIVRVLSDLPSQFIEDGRGDIHDSLINGNSNRETESPDDSLNGTIVLITSGPTHEYIDPVRFISNPSSGKMGKALALEAGRRGAKVHLVTGPVDSAHLPRQGVVVHQVKTAEQMLQRVRELADEVDLFIFAAAVGDFKAAQPISQKIKRTGNSITLPLTENPDIAQEISYRKTNRQITIGFAAETQNMDENALAKLARKKLDVIVANDVSDSIIGFNSEDNAVTIYRSDGSKQMVERRSKPEVAKAIFEAVLPMVSKARAL